jgi:hypothetical protein
LVLIAIVGLIGWTGFLLTAQFRAPVQLRSAARWVAIAGLLVASG